MTVMSYVYIQPLISYLAIRLSSKVELLLTFPDKNRDSRVSIYVQEPTIQNETGTKEEKIASKKY